MSGVEIPLLRESRSFVARLAIAAARHGGGVYHQARRVNWSYRWSEAYYSREAALFTAWPEAYLTRNLPDTIGTAPEVEDVYARRLGSKDILRVLIKACAHWAFLALGAPARHRARHQPYKALRKGYVEDIELVFDPEAVDVFRLVFPFPLGLKRQRRYLARLRREGRAFALCGVPYSPVDLWQVLRRRTLGAAQRLETRAQLRLAARLGRLSARRMELSDEFDIGCLDFCRRLQRVGFEVVNSAHGVGKYLPMHAFDTFNVLTRQQENYYTGLHPCTYAQRRLNAPPVPVPPVHPDDPLTLVILGQAAPHVSPILRDAEADLLDRTQAALVGLPGIRVLFKPHPNNHDSAGTSNRIPCITDLAGINGHPKTVFCSFFSTCQVDPAFAGHKYLLRAPLIYPEIAFDPEEPILIAENLFKHVLEMAGK